MEQSSTYTVGKDVLSFCNKCNLPLSHTIMCMQDSSRIAKVKCNTCHNEHKFKDPALATKKSGTTVKKAPSKKATAALVAQGNMENIWEKAMKNAHGVYRPYSIKGNYVAGDVIEHAKFGPGVVESKLEGDKLNVIFRTESKILINNK